MLFHRRVLGFVVDVEANPELGSIGTGVLAGSTGTVENPAPPMLG